MMGNYIVTAREIAVVIDNALDNIEGDFNDKELQKALDRAKLYPFVCDKKKSVPRYVRAGNRLR